jgi:hypothetical protein
MPLFEVAIMEMPSKKEIDEGTGQEKLVFGPVCVVAKDGSTAAMRAVLDNPEKAVLIDKSKMAVLVRPFA